MGRFLGELEQTVLLAVFRLREAYGMTVRREIDERTGRDVSIGTIYITLARLAENGFLLSRMTDVAARPGGKARRVFRLTAAGLSALHEAKRQQELMWNGVVLRRRTRS